MDPRFEPTCINCSRLLYWQIARFRVCPVKLPNSVLFRKNTLLRENSRSDSEREKSLISNKTNVELKTFF